MKEFLKAFSPTEKLYCIERIHSRLIHLTYFNGVMSDEFDTKGYSIDLILNSLKGYIQCCNEFGNNKYFKNYIRAIDQAKLITSKFRNKEKEFNKDFLTRSYNLMYGRFIQFRNAFKKKFNKYCEIEYQQICVPLYKLEKQFL